MFTLCGRGKAIHHRGTGFEETPTVAHRWTMISSPPFYLSLSLSWLPLVHTITRSLSLSVATLDLRG